MQGAIAKWLKPQIRNLFLRAQVQILLGSKVILRCFCSLICVPTVTLPFCIKLHNTKMASVEAIEEYLDAVQEYFFSSLSVVTNGLPNVHEAVNRLWVDISRYGPGMPAFPDVHIPTLGDFQVPPPPPPVPKPVPSSCITRSLEWVGNHPWKASGLVLGVLGAGFLAGYHNTASTRVGRRYNHKNVSTSERKQVVGKSLPLHTSLSHHLLVILGGDSPYALPLILDLERKGFIVIASVATVEGVEALEHQCKGYVKALVLDPQEVRLFYLLSERPYLIFKCSQKAFQYFFALFRLPCLGGFPLRLLGTPIHYPRPSHTFTPSFLSSRSPPLHNLSMHPLNTFHCVILICPTSQRRTSLRCRLYRPFCLSSAQYRLGAATKARKRLLSAYPPSMHVSGCHLLLLRR